MLGVYGERVEWREDAADDFGESESRGE